MFHSRKPLVILLMAWGLLLTAQATLADCTTKTPGCHPDNRRYLQDADGDVLYLTGSHFWNDFQDWGTTDPPPKQDIESFLDFLQANGHNFLRGWTWEHARWAPWVANSSSPSVHFSEGPYLRVCGGANANDGKPRYDLDRFNDAYFRDLKGRIQAAGRRNMYVSVMLFQGWSLKRPGQPGDPWQSHPFHHSNNCNGIDGDPVVPSLGGRTGEGRRIHTMELPAVRARQEAYVRRMIDELYDLDNIIWEISNESHSRGDSTSGYDFGTSFAWQERMIQTIRSHEAGKSKKHLVMMSGDTSQASVNALNNSSADILGYGGNTYKNPPDFNAANPASQKIAILDTDHIWGLGGFHTWVWQSFTSGYHPIFMDPQFGIPLYPGSLDPTPAERGRIRKSMGRTRQFAETMDLASMVPSRGLCNNVAPGAPQRPTCLVSPGDEYLIYQNLHSNNSQGLSNAFTVEMLPGTYDFTVLDAFSDTVTSQGSMVVTQAGPVTFSYPARPVVHLVKQQTLPDAPTAISATDGTFTNRVRISWDSVLGADSYRVFRCTADVADCQNFQSIGTTPGLSFDDVGLAAGISRAYSVKAINAFGTSEFGQQDSGYRGTGALITDFFNNDPPNRELGDGLNGLPVEVGGRTWNAVSGLGFAFGEITNLNTFASQVGGVPFDPDDHPTRRFATVEAKINPSQSEWIGLGFSRSARGHYWADGQIWAFLRPNGRLKVAAQGTQHTLYDGFPGAQAGANHLKLEYDRSANSVRAWLNGVTIPMANPDLDSRGFIPNIEFAGFHGFKGGGYPPQSLHVDELQVDVSGSLDPQSMTLPCNADAYVSQGAPNSNFGFSQQLRVRNLDVNQGLYSFLRFNVPNVNGTIVSAKLRLHSYGVPIENLGVFRVNNMSWSEGTVTWNNWGQGVSFTQVASATNLAANSWHEIDVTSAVIENQVLNIGLNATQVSATGRQFYSRESPSRKPVLVIEYEP